MKKLIIAAGIILIVASCKKENEAPALNLMEQPDTSTVAVKQGVFQNGPYGNVTGKVTLYRNYNGSFNVFLDSFMTSNGPDLYVYLSREIMPASFIELEKLRSVNGSQLYSIPGAPDFTQFKYVNIHCKRYNHLFGYALLQ
ncbi:MAG: DM13 domain-containing protein [Rhizobacter sp.]|nr:DM13 domain-containing protein [Ferruginibacter sp.]